LFVLISNLAFGSFDFAKSPVFPLIFLLAIVFLFNPIRNRVQKFIDRVFYRLEYNYQETVQQISESMRTLLGLDQIGKNIMDTALGTMFIDSGSVMLLRKDENHYRCLIQAGETDHAIRNAGNGNYLAQDDEGDQTTDPAKNAAEDQSTRTPSDIALAVDEPLIQKIAEQKKEVIIYDIQEDPFFEDQRESCEKAFDQLDATLIVPLIYEDKLTGLISLGSKKSGKFYRREDINLLNILANQGAVAIENAMMLEEVIEKERMEEELNIAQDLQVSMLPAECPAIEGFELAAYSASAREVGGDFYDFIEIDEGKSGIVIGDVTGKSVSGALVMSASRSIFRMLGEEELTVSESMNRANRRTKKDIKSGMFVALLYAVLSAENKSLSLCSAGQTQPVYLSAATGEATLIETKGDTFPLGILDEALYEETQLRLESGDRIILYTDGVVEAMNEQEELFGFDRLLEVVKDSQTTTAETLLEEIKDQVNEFAGNAAQHDDITVIVIKAD
jgi:serine phosphatase RsbU (regulator of sigma subunit)